MSSGYTPRLDTFFGLAIQYGHCEHSGHAAKSSSNLLGADCNIMDDRGDADQAYLPLLSALQLQREESVSLSPELWLLFVAH